MVCSISCTLTYNCIADIVYDVVLLCYATQASCYCCFLLNRFVYNMIGVYIIMLCTEMTACCYVPVLAIDSFRHMYMYLFPNFDDIR